jgi:hypothetical protein
MWEVGQKMPGGRCTISIQFLEVVSIRRESRFAGDFNTGDESHSVFEGSHGPFFPPTRCIVVGKGPRPHTFGGHECGYCFNSMFSIAVRRVGVKVEVFCPHKSHSPPNQYQTLSIKTNRQDLEGQEDQSV